MKKSAFLLLFLFLMTSSPFFFDSGGINHWLHLSSGNTGVDQSAPVSMSQSSNDVWNIDSFDVHPTNRWDITSSGYTANIDDGLLNMSDIADGTDDYYRLEQDLRDLSGTVETRFKAISNASSSDSSDRFVIYFYGSGQIGVYLFMYKVGASGATDTRLRMYDVDGNLDELQMPASKDLHANIWYTYKVDYDILESSIRFRCFFDNGTKVFDYYNYDITTDRLAFFAAEAITIRIESGSQTVDRTDYVDYMIAPFKENEWENTDVPSDPQWLENSWDGVHIEDDVNPQDNSDWELIVPNLDHVKGTMVIDITNIANIAFSDIHRFEFGVYGVDADDGDDHPIIRFELEISEYSNPGGTYAEIHIREHTSYIHQKDVDPYSDHKIFLSFEAALREDRSNLVYAVRYGWDEDDETLQGEFLGEIDVSDAVDDPSQEFILKTMYDCTMQGNMEVVMYLRDFDYTSDDFWSDAFGLFAPILAPWLFDTAVAGATGNWDPIRNVIDDMVRALALVFVVVFNPLLEDISDMLDFFDPLIDAVQDIIDQFIAAIGTFIDDFITYLGTVIDDVTGLFFTFYDDAGLPDFLSILDKFFNNLVTTIGKIPAGFDDIKAYIDFWAEWLVIFMTAIALGYPLLGYTKTRNVGLYMQDFIKIQTININPFQGSGTVLWVIPAGMYIPYCLLWFPLFLFELGWSG